MSEKQAHLNGAYYGPSIPASESYHRPRRGGGGGPLGCCCCIFGLVFKLIFTAVVFMGLAFLVFWLIVRPTRVKFHVTDVKLSQFNFSTDSKPSTITSLSTSPIPRNPNKKIGVYYDRIEATALYEGQRLSTVPLTPFYQGYKNQQTFLNPVFKGQQLIVGSNLLEEFNQQKSAGVYEIEMKIYLRIRFKLGRIKTGKFKPRIECDLNIPLNNGNSVSTFQTEKCSVDYFNY
ncbi:hypothetical protein M0R45_029944 [Rubus argutus]|uniref:Late embryogenesis abundant protein LEA-2 subgroup domain-containing protein n=1 Tax=Rubus argutus TaxID=59490 RepID=A0AAW1WDG2_RUBAR